MKFSQALLVIDMQLVAFDGKVVPPIVDGARLLDKVAELIGLCRARHMPIVYVQTRAIPGQPYSKEVHGWEMHPEVAPLVEDPVVFKRNSSAFDGTDLQDVLQGLGVAKLWVCGIWSEFCVANTSRDALELGFGVLVAADGHGTVAASVDAARETVAQQNRLLAEHGAQVLTIAELTASEAR